MWAAGEIAAAIYNVNRGDSRDRVWTAADFVPRPLSEISQTDNEPEPEEAPSIEGLVAFFGTKDKKEKAFLVPGK